MQGYVESVLRRKKSIPYEPHVQGKQVESIQGTCKNMIKTCIQFEYYNLTQCTLDLYFLTLTYYLTLSPPIEIIPNRAPLFEIFFCAPVLIGL
jgi:hypothetical protein